MTINLLATWIPALLIALSGVLKLSGNPKIVEAMSTLGVGRYLRLLGVMEVAFAALFVIPATMKLGFILASLLLQRCDRDGAVARRIEGQSIHPDRTALDRRFHSGSLDLFLIQQLLSAQLARPTISCMSVRCSAASSMKAANHCRDGQ